MKGFFSRVGLLNESQSQHGAFATLPLFDTGTKDVIRQVFSFLLLLRTDKLSFVNSIESDDCIMMKFPLGENSADISSTNICLAKFESPQSMIFITLKFLQ